MTHHEIGDDVLITGVLVVRAWGLDRFNDTFKKAAHCVVNGEIPLLPGVLYEAEILTADERRYPPRARGRNG